MLTSKRGLSAAIILTLSSTATPVLGQETAPPAEVAITGNATLVSDYRFRGLSQSNGDPAIQAAITATHASGFYASVWASSTEFKRLGPVPDATYGNLELDFSGGWSGEIASGLTADAGLTYYTYPGGKQGHANFFEPYATLTTTLGPASAKVGVNYAWRQASLNFNGDARNDDNVYLWGELSSGIPATPLTLTAHLGWAKGAMSPKFATGQTAGYAGGLDWSLAAIANLNRNLSLGVTYVGVQGNRVKRYSGDKIVASLRYFF